MWHRPKPVRVDRLLDGGDQERSAVLASDPYGLLAAADLGLADGKVRYGGLSP